MAGFKGLHWAPGQMHYALSERDPKMLAADAPTYAVSKSIHYGLGLSFEGIRFFVREHQGRLQAVFVTLDHNLGRFRRGMAYNLSDAHQDQVPSADALRQLIVDYLGHPRLRPFMTEMARTQAQGYLRPFTVDDSQSIGVTFPANTAIRLVAARYQAYMGEPFHGVSIPWLVRAVALNGTGHLKLGVNYLQSIKAVQAAMAIRPEAAAALFLDDQPHLPVRERMISEWDTSCALFAFKDGSVLKIPESPLILPSVTIQGLVSILRQDGVPVHERHLSYGELLDRVQDIVTVCSIGTAGVLARCDTLTLTGDDRQTLAVITSDSDHPLFKTLGRARATYWDVYTGAADPAPGMVVEAFDLGAPSA